MEGLNADESQTSGLIVAQYMTTNPITVRSDVTFTDAVAKMTSNRIGKLIVVENEKPAFLQKGRFYNPYHNGKEFLIGCLSMSESNHSRH
jgi:CBS domain-containing protein